MKSSSLSVLHSACTTNWAYRAICHDNWSAHCVAFLPRDDMLARYMLSSRVRLSVRPSVRLSFTSRYCIETVRRTELVYGTGPKLCYKEIRISPKIRVLPCGTLPQTLDLENFATISRSTKLADGRACGLHLRWSSASLMDAQSYVGRL